MTILNKAFWEQKYLENKTGWDIGDISTPLKSYIDQLTNKNLKILIPGAGNSYEAEYLWKKGFKNVYVVDIAKQPLKNLKQRLPDIPKQQLLNKDFFDLNDSFDLIIEQTFFCALQPSLRKKYAKKMYELLNLNGKIAGLLFDFELNNEGPPFGGSKAEYLNLFTPTFYIKTLRESYNSIKPRQGKELFFIFEKNNQ
ncbi:methyltransferase domain-containing protein [Pontimicrobium aquaticum]|uniref:Methyltransferase n=1 Tax=Pontimicrobium aquaticum TaxID=2565367 RepID=A0A4U0EKX4_9FLAO|nr:methyltransferase domain-containing protein [Pontimicrobium aquaticum]TJY32173.1 methyltransferase [Pontimicrobium aquaticum]